MVELATATDKAGKAIAEGKAQLHKNLEKVKRCRCFSAPSVIDLLLVWWW